MGTDRFDTHELVLHEPTSAQRRQTVLVVATQAHDAADLATLLAMLGMDATDARPAADPVPEPRPAVAQALPPKYLAELTELAAGRRRTRRRNRPHRTAKAVPVHDAELA